MGSTYQESSDKFRQAADSGYKKIRYKFYCPHCKLPPWHSSYSDDTCPKCKRKIIGHPAD